MQVPPALFQPPDAESDQGGRWWEVVELTKLDLSHNDISLLSSELTGLTSLHTLLVANNALGGLPAGLSALPELRALDVSDNAGLRELPEEISELTRLANLSCGGCGLATLPAALGAAQPSLSLLSAPRNALAALPTSLGGASALVVVDLCVVPPPRYTLRMRAPRMRALSQTAGKKSLRVLQRLQTPPPPTPLADAAAPGLTTTWKSCRTA